MRHSQAEKMEIIRMVEQSGLSVKATLKELGINRSTFYGWYRRYVTDGYDGLVDKKPIPKKFWNKIPEHEKEQIVDIALEYPEKSPRQLAWFITDTQGYFISESSVYRILKSYDLITSPAYIVLSAKDKFDHPTGRVNELWQTDFSYFRIIAWGWYYLSTVLDDYSRYIIAWNLSPTMSATDVQATLDVALEKTGIEQVTVKLKPRLLSDNGPCYLSKDLKEYLQNRDIKHIRGAPYHPQTQGKIERYHRSIKNVITLQNYYLPGDLNSAISEFVDYYNNKRYHESLNNLTPADVFYGRSKEIITKREITKWQTMQLRRYQNLDKNGKKALLQLF
jgi:transposase InsO family protein/transposase-like protein